MTHNQYKITKTWYKHDGRTFQRGDTLFKVISKIDGREYLVDKNNDFVCMISSENAHTYAVGNDDNKWAERNDLIEHIKAYCIERKDLLHLLYESRTAQKYNKNRLSPDQPLLWTNDFYCAPLYELNNILGIFNMQQVLDTDKALIIF